MMYILGIVDKNRLLFSCLFFICVTSIAFADESPTAEQTCQWIVQFSKSNFYPPSSYDNNMEMEFDRDGNVSIVFSHVNGPNTYVSFWLGNCSDFTIVNEIVEDQDRGTSFAVELRSTSPTILSWKNKNDIFRSKRVWVGTFSSQVSAERYAKAWNNLLRLSMSKYKPVF